MEALRAELVSLAHELEASDRKLQAAEQQAAEQAGSTKGLARCRKKWLLLSLRLESWRPKTAVRLPQHAHFQSNYTAGFNRHVASVW